MTSRQRVLCALEFRRPDRVPLDFWASEGFYRKLHAATGLDPDTFLDEQDVDLRYIPGPRYIGPPLSSPLPGCDLDLWGVPRRAVDVQLPGGRETYREVAAHPLADARTPRDIEAYPHWPDPDWFDYSAIADQCQTARRKDRVVVFMGDRLNRVAQLKPAMYLRGIERIFLDLIESPDIADTLFSRLRRFYRHYLDRVLTAARGGIDIVLTGDDFGAQNGPLLSPALWRRHLREGFQEYMHIIHRHGARAMHHTCGMVTPLVEDLKNAGLDILQSLQPEAMSADFPVLKRAHARSLAFHGGISIQQTMPRGSPSDVREEVRRRIETLAPGGGYILCTAHNIQADCPVENALALLRAGRELTLRTTPE